MNASADRLEFAPPPTPGLVRAVGLAILAHAFLLAALTWGVQWKQSPTTLSVEAELWAAVPQQAAPPPAPPAPPPPPVPQAKAPPPPPPPAEATPKAPDPEIALERERQRLRKEKQVAADKLAQDKREQERKAEEKIRDLYEKRALEKERALEKRLAADKQKAVLEAKRQDTLKSQQEADKKIDALRQANLQRMAGLAGTASTANPPNTANTANTAGTVGTAGAPASTGTAAQTAGPSAGYAGRVQAKVRPNIVFTASISDDIITDVEVRTGPDGTIVSRKLIKSSGNKAWDEAVLKALDKTDSLPRDVDGRIPSPLVIGFRP
jgi:colicin import membrane protein